MRWSVVLLSMLCAWLALGAHATAQDSAPAADASAETAALPQVATLLSHVREADREGLAARAGRADWQSVPLYDLHLSIGASGFGLRERIAFTNESGAPMREIMLRIFANAVPRSGEGPAVRMLRGTCLGALSCALTQPAPSVIRVVPSAPLAPGARIVVELDLQGRLSVIDDSRLDMLQQGLESMQRMGSAGPPDDYGLLSTGGGITCLANFYAVLAHRRAGAWDVDDHGTHGDLGVDRVGHVYARVVVPAQLRVVSSGREVASRPVRDAPGAPARREYEIHAGAIRDFAVLAGESLQSVARDVGGVQVRSWYVSGHEERGRAVLLAAASAFEVFERRFGRYPYTELDVVEAPVVGGAGGVEFSTLVTVSTSFYRPASASGLGAMLGLGQGGGDAGALGAAIEFVTAHEVAHQWWYGIVGSDARLHPVADEALAQWSAMLAMEERYDAARAQADGDRNIAMNYRMMRMMGHADAAADRAVADFATPIEYAGLVYGKAPFFYRALRTELGDAALFSGLAAYAAAHFLREAAPTDIVRVFATGRSARRVRALARRYFDEAHGDDDIGEANAGGVMAGMLPPELQQAIESDPAMRAMMESLMSGMLGGGGGAGGGGGGMEGIDPAMLQQMMQMLGGGDAAELQRELERATGGGGPTRVAP